MRSTCTDAPWGLICGLCGAPLVQAPRKVYACDPGFVSAVGFRSSADSGCLLESLVAIELARQGREFFTYKEPSGKEVDFVVRRAGVTSELIQVCYDLSDPKTRKREVAGLLRAARDLSCGNLLLLTWDEEGEIREQENSIKLLPVWKWLCRC